MGWVTSVITPALVASVVTLLVNLRSEKSKAHREVMAKTFERARLVVSEATRASSAYYSLPGQKRTGSQLSALQTSEKAFRVLLGNLIDWCPRLSPPIDGKTLQGLADDFVYETTNGSFGATTGPADHARAEKVADIGARVEVELLLMQQNQSFEWLKRDPLERFICFWNEPMGPPPDYR